MIKVSIHQKGIIMSLFHFRNFHKKMFPAVRCLAVILAGATIFAASLTAHAGVKEENMAANQAVPVESNQIDGWPQGPTVSARSAILIEAETGTILYAKNIHNKEYPASTTKILTTLIASELCDMNEMVTFSHDAIYDTPYDSNHIALDVGESLTMEDCLKAILIRSANEVSFGVAEHISGTSWEDFASIMNERATELGALNSNFVNPNGLPDENHYTTAYDLAMIGRAFFANDILCNMTTSRMLEIQPSETQPDHIMEVNQMSLIRGGKYEYEYLVGCKTGYTNDARSSLVSCAEKDGLKLICVVFRDEAPYQYEDTIALFEYGFSNFRKMNVSENDTKYTMSSGSSYYNGNDILGNSQPILSLNTSDYIVIPNTVEFTDTESSISYETDSDVHAALITYTYQDWVVGTASIDFTGSLESTYEFELSADPECETAAGTDADNRAESVQTGTGNGLADQNSSAAGTEKPSSGSAFAKIGKTVLIILLVLIALAAIAIVVIFIRNYLIVQRRRRRRQRSYSLRRSNDPYAIVNATSKRKNQIADAKRRQRAAKSRRRDRSQR